METTFPLAIECEAPCGSDPHGCGNQTPSAPHPAGKRHRNSVLKEGFEALSWRDDSTGRLAFRFAFRKRGTLCEALRAFRSHAMVSWSTLERELSCPAEWWGGVISCTLGVMQKRCLGIPGFSAPLGKQ